MKRIALDLLRGRVAGSETAQLAAAAADTEEKLGEARAAADAAREKKVAMAAAAKVRTRDVQSVAGLCAGLLSTRLRHEQKQAQHRSRARDVAPPQQ